MSPLSFGWGHAVSVSLFNDRSPFLFFLRGLKFMLGKCQSVALPPGRRHVISGYRRGCLIGHAADPAGAIFSAWSRNLIGQQVQKPYYSLCTKRSVNYFTPSSSDIYNLHCRQRSKRQFDIRKSVHHHTIKINQPTRCNSFTRLLLDVDVWLNKFRAPPRPSSGAYNCTRSLWFYRCRVAVGALLVVVCQTTTNNALTAS